MASLNLPDARTSYFRRRTKVAHRVEGGEVTGAPRQLRVSEDGWRRRAIQQGTCGTRKKIIWSATAGGFIVGKAARGAISDQVGRLEAGQRRDVPITGLNVPFPASKVNLRLSNPPPHPNKAS
jgi:hypothetical protein